MSMPSPPSDGDGDSYGDGDGSPDCTIAARSFNDESGIGWARVIENDISSFSLHLNNKSCSCTRLAAHSCSEPASLWRVRMRVPMLMGSSIQSRLRG